ncbi:HlyD family secretion protein [Fluviicola taffensis]|uniref:Secretion protein HlyD family protein n=1 Tax=Fluviicola taffensis (strain DSM 16823 / NCIMB 13979 / RW262) TaxID=755732 RepID=F2IJ05_FLUTR|nr:biotin/lipoyl-binding protein [Fluviicola taffensis]AEA43863.1 secretion protein HlyD family protein [Fluviicola taffensis DSM 16823]
MKTQINIAIAASLIVGLTGCSENTSRPVEGKIKRKIISFTPKVTGRVLKIYVEEGDIVQPGDTLAMLDVPEVDAKLKQVSGVVKAATAQNTMANNGATSNQRKQLKAKYAAASEQFQFAEKSYNRAKAMFDDGLMAPQNYDEVFVKYQASKAQLDAVTAELNEVEKGVRFETKDATFGQKEQALGALEEVEIAYSEKYIIATNTMQIETISLNEGELATAGYALFNGYIPASTYFRMTIPESEIGQYKIGQELTLMIPYNKQSVKGKIRIIKQLSRYADITAAYPDYQLEDAIYELKIIPNQTNQLTDLLVNATVILEK